MAQASTDPSTTERPGVIWRRQIVAEAQRVTVLELARELDPDLTNELDAMTDPAEMQARLLAYLRER